MPQRQADATEEAQARRFLLKPLRPELRGPLMPILLDLPASMACGPLRARPRCGVA
ncbi:hypothetical protein HMPREF9946_00872 [Acetobacteraceae bacterium AT-5844]|nr:hypothetical protein HMPREF9946_00872 [Acetobacteraceae bacterium AT-5844]